MKQNSLKTIIFIGIILLMAGAISMVTTIVSHASRQLEPVLISAQP